MDEFVICDICMETYDGALRCPRMFTCGHSFCSACVQKLLTTSSFCPTCKLSIAEERLESISINYALKQIVENYLCRNANGLSGSLVNEERECTTQPKVESVISKGFCNVHKVYKHFRCMTCSMWVCGDCVVISHILCKTLLVKEAIEEMKEEFATILDCEVDSSILLDHHKVVLGVKNELLKCYQQKLIVLKEEICEANRIIEKVSDMQTVLTCTKERLESQMKVTNVTYSGNNLDNNEENLTEHFSSLQDVVENLRIYKSSMAQIPENEILEFFNNKEKLMAYVTAGEKILITANADSYTRYGKLDIKEGIFRIHSMQQKLHPPSPLCITLDNCLTTITGRKEWPWKIFLQFSSNGVPLGDVIICLNKSAKVATKTVLRMCLVGEEGRSIEGVGMTYSDFIVDSIWSDLCLPFPSDVDYDSLQKEKKRKNWEEGEMCLHVWNENNGLEFNFWICVKGSNKERESIPTGHVEEGIEVIKDAYRRIRERGERVKVVNCGWVLS